jgi:hypothetical protein
MMDGLPNLTGATYGPTDLKANVGKIVVKKKKGLKSPFNY